MRERYDEDERSPPLVLGPGLGVGRGGGVAGPAGERYQVRVGGDPSQRRRPCRLLRHLRGPNRLRRDDRRQGIIFIVIIFFFLKLAAEIDPI